MAIGEHGILTQSRPCQKNARKQSSPPSVLTTMVRTKQKHKSSRMTVICNLSVTFLKVLEL